MSLAATLLGTPLRHAVRTVLPRHRHQASQFNVLNLSKLNRELLQYGATPLTEQESDPARFILFQALSRAKCFPQPLTNRDFQEWLVSQTPFQIGERLRDVFAQPPGEPVKRVFEVREDLREKYPLALTPVHRREYLAWLLAHGRDELKLTETGIIWCLVEQAHAADQGLIATYLLQPEWQVAVPDALFAAGWPKLIEWLRRRYSLNSNWFNKARWQPTLRPADEQRLNPRIEVKRMPAPWQHRLFEDIEAKLTTRPGVNVIGHYRYASGLQEACVGVVKALQNQGYRIARRDWPVHHPADWSDRERYQDLELFDTSICVAAVNTFPDEYHRRAGLHPRAGVDRIAYWYWEVDKLPEEWEPKLRWAREVWAPTRFLAETYRKHVSVPVLPMLPGVALPEFMRRTRGFFDLPADRWLVLFNFDMGSVMERKNPLGLVEAFRRAFRNDDRVQLCIKVSRGEFHPENLAKLNAACKIVNGVVLNHVLPRGDVLALLANADCYASLHRAEGLGLGLAESMLLGTPVVATRYSGNLDFMDGSTAKLVDCREVEIVDTPPYPAGSHWAEPDVDHAAACLRDLFERRDEAAAMADRGRDAVQRILSVKAAGARMAQRLRERRQS